MSLQSGKAPGLDGFTPEFYKKIETSLMNPLIDLFQHSIEQNVAPNHSRGPNHIDLQARQGS